MSSSYAKRSTIPDEAPFILISRILVVLITLLLAVIPWSERYSILDSFPHSQDTEFNLLACFVILGLILLIARSGRKRLRTLLAFRHVLLSIVRPAVSLVPRSGHGLLLTNADDPPLPRSSLDLYNLPLQI